MLKVSLVPRGKSPTGYEQYEKSDTYLLNREQLLDRVWGYDYAPGSNIVDVYITTDFTEAAKTDDLKKTVD